MNIVLERWNRKLVNWALWRMGSQGYGGNSAYDGTWGDGAPRPPKPLVGEALDVDDLVQKLTTNHREAVEVHYLWTIPETLEERAAELGIHRDTLSDRLRQAMFRLEAMDCDRRLAMVRVAA